MAGAEQPILASTEALRPWPQLSQGEVSLSIRPEWKIRASHPRTIQIIQLSRYTLAVCAAAAVTILLVLSVYETGSVNPLDIFWTRGGTTLSLGLSIIATVLSVIWAWYRDRSRSILSLSRAIETEKNIALESFISENVRSLLRDAASRASADSSVEIQLSHFVAALFDNSRMQLVIARGEYSYTEVASLAQEIYGDKSKSRYHTNHFLSTEVADVLTEALLYCHRTRALSIQAEDLFFTLLMMKDEKSQTLRQALQENLGVTTKMIERLIVWYAEDEARASRYSIWRTRGSARPRTTMNRAWTAVPTPMLNHFGVDLALSSDYGVFSVGTGRESEIETAIRILGTEGGLSLLLVGEQDEEPDVVIEAIASQIISAEAPESIADKRLVRLDLTSLLASSADPEKILASLLEEIETAGNVVLVIPNVQQLVTNGTSFNSSSVLANAIERKWLTVITTASYPDYHRYVEQNTALSSLLRVIEMKPLETNNLIRILETHVVGLEAEHDVTVTLPAIEEAASLSSRYLSDRKQPRAAKSVLDEACLLAGTSNRHWVTRAVVREAIESITPVPITTAKGTEAEALLDLESRLEERIVGQKLAVKLVSEAIRRARAGLTNPKRPLSSFMFVGPTGVGKTELAKALAREYFGDTRPMIRFDMSEYQDSRSLYKLIGAPPDGSGEPLSGGTLTQAVREHPFSLLLFDEIEKAHPDVLNIFLQILDDAQVTENSGRTVKLTSCIIIATSNAQAQQIAELFTKDPDYSDVHAQATMRILESSFKPELLNRFDAIVPFHPLTSEDLETISGLIIADISKRVEARGITIEVPKETLWILIPQGTDARYGARPLRRVLEQKIEGAVAKLLLSNAVKEGEHVVITPGMIQ